MLQKCIIRVRFCHNYPDVENSNYPQVLGGVGISCVENTDKVWKKDIFPADFSKNAVDKSGENSG